MTTLTDQTVLITGANRGLGREFVEQFLTRGVAKVYAAARNPESITTDDPRVVPLQLDVTDPDSVARVAATAHDVSIVVNNAGVSTPTPVLSGDTANLRRELEVNLFGPLAVTTRRTHDTTRRPDRPRHRCEPRARTRVRRATPRARCGARVRRRPRPAEGRRR